MTLFKSYLLGGAALIAAASPAWAAGGSNRYGAAPVNHVLLLSVDGMHEVDLALWAKNHPGGALAALSRRGTTYTNAYTTAPSDSFPGLIAQVTGGTPYSAGVFYDDSYDRTFFPPSSNCAGTPGAETTYAENIDYSLADITGGGTLGQPLTQINPNNLPQTLVNGVCTNVLPHQFIRVNTIFEVIRAHGGHTAWSDKHPAYEILNGPSGTGVEDLYTPEINSQVPGAPAGDDYTTAFGAVQTNDAVKVKSVINQINTLDSTGGTVKGYTPSIFGMNFQAVSVGQKLAKAGFNDPAGYVGGYLDAAGTPGNALSAELSFVDDSVAAMVDALKVRGLYNSTLIIISAKHGQSPIDRSLRRAIPDTYSTVLANDDYGFNIADDASLIWLKPSGRTPATYQAALNDLAAQQTALGIAQIVGQGQLATIFRNPLTDSRTPDIFVVSDHGVIYTGGSKLAEHGGVASDDRHVALLVSGAGLSGGTVGQTVFTTQIAPTILSVLGIAPSELEAVQIEHTTALPNLGGGNEGR